MIDAQVWLRNSYPALVNSAEHQARMAERARFDELAKSAVWSTAGLEEANSLADRLNAARIEAARQEAEEQARAAAAWRAAELATPEFRAAETFVTASNVHTDDPAVAIAAAETARRLAPDYLAGDPNQRLPWNPGSYAEMGMGPAQPAAPMADIFKSDVEVLIEHVLPPLAAAAAFTPAAALVPTTSFGTDPVADDPRLEARMGIPSVLLNVGKFVAGAVLGNELDKRRDSPPPLPGVQGQGMIPNDFTLPGLIDWGKERLTAGTEAARLLTGGIPGKALGGVAPRKKSVSTLVCPTGYALAIDGVCYPKSQIPKQLRKWKPEPRPVVSRSDQKAITRSAAAKKRLVKITKAAGAHASLTKPHHHHPTGKKR